MAKLPWLVCVLLVHAACGDDDKGDDGGSGPCHSLQKAEVPRADYDAANADGELSSEECEDLCQEYLVEHYADEYSGVPECEVQALGASVVTVQCSWVIGCE